eukprot:2026882-Pyramimonas_sp.AAC.1
MRGARLALLMRARMVFRARSVMGAPLSPNTCPTPIRSPARRCRSCSSTRGRRGPSASSPSSSPGRRGRRRRRRPSHRRQDSSASR